MNTSTSIAEKQDEIKKQIAILMALHIQRLSKRRKKDSGDYQYPFKLYLDELPFFSLYVNLKKAVYENLLILAHRANTLTDSDYAFLGNVGINKAKNGLKFRALSDKEFRSTPINSDDAKLLLESDYFEEYLEEIELCLLQSSSTTKAMQALLIDLTDVGKIAKCKLGEDGDLPYSLVDNGEVDDDEVAALKEDVEGHWLYSQYAEGLGAKQAFRFPCGEQVGWTFINAKNALADANHIQERDPTAYTAGRADVLQAFNERYFQKVCAVLNTVVEILSIPIYQIPNETIFAVLEQTLLGVKRVVFAKQLEWLTSGKDKKFSSGELMTALGCKSEKYSAYTSIYGEKAFTDEEVKVALEKMGQPTNLFDI